MQPLLIQSDLGGHVGELVLGDRDGEAQAGDLALGKQILCWAAPRLL